MKDFLYVFERPLKFFKEEKSFERAFAHFFIATLIFIFLNELMIYTGLITVERSLSVLAAILSNLLSIVSGYFIITAFSFFPLAAMGKTNYKDFFVVTAYALTPLIFFWIPHILPQAIVIIWSIMLMIIGTAQTMKISYKRAFIPVATFLTLTILGSFVIGNYLIVPLNRI